MPYLNYLDTHIIIVYVNVKYENPPTLFLTEKA